MTEPGCNRKCEALFQAMDKVKQRFYERKAHLEMELKALEMKINEEQDILRELREFEKEEEERDALEREMKSLMEANRKMELQIQQLKSDIKKFKNYEPSALDEAKLLSVTRKLWLYEDVTGIRWDPKSDNTRGYVKNPMNLYIKQFSMESPSEDQLWEEIAKASSADWSGFLCE